MNDRELWDLELQFWVGSSLQIVRAIDRDCVVVLPEPVGMLTGLDLLENIDRFPRWRAVSMTRQVIRRPTDGIAILGYAVSAEDAGRPPHLALCTSTYRPGLGIWKLIQHQRTPI